MSEQTNNEDNKEKKENLIVYGITFVAIMILVILSPKFLGNKGTEEKIGNPHVEVIDPQPGNNSWEDAVYGAVYDDLYESVANAASAELTKDREGMKYVGTKKGDGIHFTLIGPDMPEESLVQNALEESIQDAEMEGVDFIDYIEPKPVEDSGPLEPIKANFVEHGQGDWIIVELPSDKTKITKKSYNVRQIRNVGIKKETNTQDLYINSDQPDSLYYNKSVRVAHPYICVQVKDEKWEEALKYIYIQNAKNKD
jgi:hypothetical protein